MLLGLHQGQWASPGSGQGVTWRFMGQMVAFRHGLVEKEGMAPS